MSESGWCWELLRLGVQRAFSWRFSACPRCCDPCLPAKAGPFEVATQGAIGMRRLDETERRWGRNLDRSLGEPLGQHQGADLAIEHHLLRRWGTSQCQSARRTNSRSSVVANGENAAGQRQFSSVRMVQGLFFCRGAGTISLASSPPPRRPRPCTWASGATRCGDDMSPKDSVRRNPPTNPPTFSAMPPPRSATGVWQAPFASQRATAAAATRAEVRKTAVRMLGMSEGVGAVAGVSDPRGDGGVGLFDSLKSRRIRSILTCRKKNAYMCARPSKRIKSGGGLAIFCIKSSF